MKLLLVLILAGNLTPHDAREIRQQRHDQQKVAVVGAPLCDAACIECESGWDPQALSDTGKYWGLYQYDYTSWIADGGNPATYGNAPAEEQHEVARSAPGDRWPNC